MAPSSVNNPLLPATFAQQQKKSISTQAITLFNKWFKKGVPRLSGLIYWDCAVAIFSFGKNEI
jgi:hypothetical protein